jgi:hypothetical protein
VGVIAAVLVALLVAPPVGAAVAGTGPRLLLDADFDDEPLDFLIGLGGPGEGQPVDIDPGLLAIAAQAMRHLLIEMARARVASKRGGGAEHVDLDEFEIAQTHDAEELLEIDDLLRRLEADQPQQAAVVACRFFAGLSEEETATALALSTRTVQREWARAREWLAAQDAP